jgi:hypothetical protein
MYTVRWMRTALNELASLWTGSDSAQRHAITVASQLIDEDLRDQPENKGESRPKGRRILFVPPLGVTLRVDPQHGTVWVLHVWRFGRRTR